MNNGVSCYDGRVWRTFGLAGNSILNAFQDEMGRLWFGTTEGISVFDGQTWVSYTREDGLSGEMVWPLYQEKSGRLWATWSFGFLMV